MNKPDNAAATSGTTACSCADPLTFGSLFAGIGGIDLGFERAGMVCKWQVEIDDYARRVLAKHWPDVRRHDDVRTWPQPDSERVDVIAGGFPCQDISYAGKGAGLAGERSGLFYEAVRVVREMGPRIVVMENVSALLTRGLDAVLGTMDSIGYDSQWHCIPASAVGAPHRRDRVFIVSYSKSERCRTWRPWRIAGVGSRQEDAANVADAEDAVRRSHSGVAASGRTDNRQQPRRPVSGTMSRDNWWADEPAVGRVADGVPNRLDRLRGLGNAVVPQVAEWIGRRIVEASRDVD